MCCVVLPSRSYYGLELLRRPTATGGLSASIATPVPIDPYRHVVFHRLLNFKKFQSSGGQSQKSGVKVKLAVAGIYDLVELLHEEELYLPGHGHSFMLGGSNPNTTNTTALASSPSSSPYPIMVGMDTTVDLNWRKVQMQIAAGATAANSLVRNKAGGVFRTAFAAKARDLVERFAVFQPEDCKVVAVS